jgi:FixJ family two-component response regulator
MAEFEQFASGEGRRILIVDDDEAVLSGLSEYFSRLGYEVVRAPTGKQGLAGFESQDPEVTILDLRLPDIDGMQILEVMRRKSALVILLTGYGDIPTAVRAMQLGAENFLTKPVDMPHLVATVERAIEKYDLRRENIRLRRLVPTAGRRVVQVVATVALIGAALLIGRWVGSAGGAPKAPPEIAPVRPSLQRSESAQPESTLPVPGITHAPASSTPPRR